MSRKQHRFSVRTATVERAACGAATVPERKAIFRLSEQGLRVRRSSTSRLPQRYQALLQAIDGLTPFDTIAACLPLESQGGVAQRSEERRVGKECRSRWS